MKLTEIFSKFFGKKEVPEGYCPNCWGHQEYAGKIVERMKEARVDLNNAEEKKGWIQAYAMKHFEGIKLRETDDGMGCPRCNARQRK